MFTSNYKDIEKLAAHNIPSPADQEKLNMLEKMLQENPHDISTLLKKAFVLFQAHADGKAIEVYQQMLKKALTIDAKRADVYYLLGCAAQKSDDSAQSIIYLEKAVQLEPSWCIPRLCLIDELLKMCKKEQARAHVQELEKYVGQVMPAPTDEMQLYYEQKITGRIMTPQIREWVGRVRGGL